LPDQQYIDGRWQPAADGATIPVINPTTEEVIAHVAAGGAAEVDRAVGSEAGVPELAQDDRDGASALPARDRGPGARAARGASAALVPQQRQAARRLSAHPSRRGRGRGLAGSWSADHITIADPAT
jgi:acyl-CoA reductase-like NAD-dependent aldehyde dehydrogenase